MCGTGSAEEVGLFGWLLQIGATLEQMDYWVAEGLKCGGPQVHDRRTTHNCRTEIKRVPVKSALQNITKSASEVSCCLAQGMN